MTKRILIGLGALVVLVAAGAAWAHGRGGRFMMKQMITAHVAEAEDFIEATPQQRALIEQSRDNILNALQAKQKDRSQAHSQLVKLLTADKLDSGDLYKIADQHAQEMQALAKVIVPEIVKVHDALTPAQRQKLAQKAEEMRAKHHGPPGGFGGPGE
jgi:periplasmic protein CpxP/Spy